MFLLDNEGKILGFDNREEDKPAPFPIKNAKWDGKKWVYPEFNNDLVKSKNIPDLVPCSVATGFWIMNSILNVINPICGTYKKEKSDKISILIPSYKKDKWVKEAIQSALDNTLKPYEIVVLAMTDEDYNSASESTDPSVKVIKNERLNVSAARNKLVELCSTEYFVFLDADDLLVKNFLKTMYEAEASIVGTSCRRWPKFQVPKRFSITASNLTCLLNKEVWNEIGGLREDLCDGHEDTFFLIEIFVQKKWLVDFTLKTLYVYRDVDENSLFSDNNSTKFYLSAEKSFYYHKDWLKEQLKNVSTNVNSILLNALENFKKDYENKSSENDVVFTKVYDINYDNSKEIALAERWNKARELFKESRTRETNCICKDANYPELYNRKFDVFVWANPSLDWNTFPEKNENGLLKYYVNNPNVNLSLTTEEILKNYCVVFSEDLNFIGDYTDHTEPIKSKIEKLKLKAKKQLEKINFNEKQSNYSLSFFLKCNKNCGYCSQKSKTLDLDEDILYKNFLKAVDKIEELHGNSWSVNILGGELTLCSDDFIRKIMERLKGHNVILMTNGNKYKESLFYSYPNLSANVHLTEPPFDDSFLREYDWSNIVLTKENFQDVIESLRNHKLKTTCNIQYYNGLDEKYKLSMDDIREFNKVYKEVFNHENLDPDEVYENCYDKTYVVRQINLWNLEVLPCCGWGEPSIPLENWNLQDPTFKHCKDCIRRFYYL